MITKHFLKGLLIATLVSPGIMVTSHAGIPYILALDEYGDVGWNFQTGPVTILSQIGTDNDPGTGSGVTTLDYLYPVSASSYLNPGWVAIYDNAQKTILSDLIHFAGDTTVNGQLYQQIFFFSDDNAGLPADNWPSSSFIATTLPTLSPASVVESQINGVAAYTPIPTQPGVLKDPSGNVYVYRFISVVPEPSSKSWAITAGCWGFGFYFFGLTRNRIKKV